MLQYLLDTNICIYLMKAQPAQLVAKFQNLRRGEVAISSVTWAELCCGLNIHNSETQMQALLSNLEVMPFHTEAATQFGKLSQAHPQRRNSFDRMIAAHCLALDLTLVTNNSADFELYQSDGLRIENWVSSESDA